MELLNQIRIALLVDSVSKHLGTEDPVVVWKFIESAVLDKVKWEQQEPEFFDNEPDGDDKEALQIAGRT